MAVLNGAIKAVIIQETAGGAGISQLVREAGIQVAGPEQRPLQAPTVGSLVSPAFLTVTEATEVQPN